MKIFIALLIILGICVFAFFMLQRQNYKNAKQQRVLGTVTECVKSKIPFAWQAVIVYSKSGKPHAAGTGSLPYWRKPKIGTKAMYTIYFFNVKGKSYVEARKVRKGDKL